MFLRQFEYLIALEKEGHFGRAAERCHVSQPSLSSALQQLEAELDVPIILRHQRYQGFTPEGERVVSWAKRLLADKKSMVEELAIMRSNLNGRLRIGAMPTSSPVLPKINQLFSALYPSVDVDIQFLGSDKLINELRNFELDVGITYLEGSSLNKLNTVTLYEEQLSLMIPKKMLPMKQDSITWAQAAELPLGLLSPNMREREVMDEAFQNVGQDPSPQLECNSIFQLAFHVMQGDIATIVPNGFSKTNDAFPGTREVSLTSPVLSKPVGLVWEKVTPPLPMAQAMADLLIESREEIFAAVGKSEDSKISRQKEVA
ncbi:LysR family transcriptional regulator [Arenicellales bacterium IMCC55707]